MARHVTNEKLIGPWPQRIFRPGGRINEFRKKCIVVGIAANVKVKSNQSCWNFNQDWAIARTQLNDEFKIPPAALIAMAKTEKSLSVWSRHYICQHTYKRQKKNIISCVGSKTCGDRLFVSDKAKIELKTRL